MARHPHPAFRRVVAASTSDHPTLASLADEREPCVVCGSPVKRQDYSTCSVSCSIQQYHLYIQEGLWVDAIDSDYRRRYGFREHWPSPYSWEVAYAEKTGSAVPGIGPRKRTVLLSFLPGLTIRDLVAEVQRACASGVEGRHVITVLGRLAPHVDSTESLRRAVDALVTQED